MKKILHITSSSNGYEEVTLLANKVSTSNRLAVIERNGEILMTGGILLDDTPEIRETLDLIPKEKQYRFLCLVRMEPFVKEDFYVKD